MVPLAASLIYPNSRRFSLSFVQSRARFWFPLVSSLGQLEKNASLKSEIPNYALERTRYARRSTRRSVPLRDGIWSDVVLCDYLS